MKEKLPGQKKYPPFLWQRLSASESSYQVSPKGGIYEETTLIRSRGLPADRYSGAGTNQQPVVLHQQPERQQRSAANIRQPVAIGSTITKFNVGVRLGVNHAAEQWRE